MQKFLASLCSVFLSLTLYSQTIAILKIENLKKRFTNISDTTYIVNFWATWCAPCVKELADFDSINNLFINDKVRVFLVSLDFKEDLNSKLYPFVKKKNLKSEVLLLDEIDGNYFIPLISQQWSGALPATLLVNNKKKVTRFFEKKVDFEFLKNEINQLSD